jgi:hypothetical protein
MLNQILQYRGTISNMAVHAFPVRTMGSTCSTRDCNMGNNIKHGGAHFSSENNGLHVLNQRLQYRRTISNMAVHAFPVRTMGSTCSTRYCNIGQQYQTWRSTLFQSEQWAPHAQPETATWGTISNMAVHAFPVRTMGSTCSTRDCNIGEQYQTWRSTLFQSEQWAPRAQPDTAI